MGIPERGLCLGVSIQAGKGSAYPGERSGYVQGKGWIFTPRTWDLRYPSPPTHTSADTKTRTVGKEVVRILLKCFLVLSVFNLEDREIIIIYCID